MQHFGLAGLYLQVEILSLQHNGPHRSGPELSCPHPSWEWAASGSNNNPPWSAPCPAVDPAPDNTKVHSLGPWGQCPAQQAAHAFRRSQDLPEGHPLPSAQTLSTGLLIPFCPGLSLSPAPAGDTVLWYSCPLSLPNQASEGPRLHCSEPPATTRQDLGERSASPMTQKPRGAPSDFSGHLG